jgi:hypothetical protein
VKEGRTWVVVRGLQNVPEVLYLSGDTIIDGHTCHKVWHHTYYREWPQHYPYFHGQQEQQEPCNAAAVYEEDKKVYLYYYGKPTPKYLYDFGAEKGDIFDGRQYVVDVDTLHRGGRSFRRLFLKYYSNGQVSESGSYSDIWVEGIGGPSCYLPTTDMKGYIIDYTKPLLSCWENGEEIFSRFDMVRTEDETPYLSMLATGKKWEYSYRNPDNPDVDYQFGYELRSDTLLCGYPFYSLYSNNVGNSGAEKFECLLCETNGMVFRIPQNYMHKHLLYDFGITEAQSVELTGFDSYCYATDRIEINGVSRRVLWMGYKDSPRTDTGIVGCWAEGIGSNGLLLEPESWLPSRYIHLDQCTLNGDVLFTEADFHLPEPVPPVMQRADYHPMLSEGKVWHYTYSNWMEDIERPVEFALRGDTVIDGKTYFKFYEEDSGTRTYRGAWREEGRKVYRCTGHTEHLMFDFGLHYHGQMPFTYTVGYSPIYLENTEVVKIKGNYFTRHNFIGDDYRLNIDFIEGIGNREGLINLNLVFGGPSSLTLDYVEENGRVIYTDADYFNEAVDYSDDITTPYAPQHTTPVRGLFDLQGRRLNAVPTRGMYIKDGRKYVK